jgi:hypothetical protein
MNYICYILDETGSMDSVRDATISGFNEYISTLQKELSKKKTKFFLTKFNSKKVDHVYEGVPLDFVAKLSREVYIPDGMTPLYDAIGETIVSMSKIVRPKDKVLFVVQTDGDENYSKEYSAKAIKDSVDTKKKEGWTFVFLGADIDAYTSGNTIGIHQTVVYSGACTRGMYTNLAVQTVNYTKSGEFDTSGDFNS